MWFVFTWVVLPVNGDRIVVLCGCHLCAVVLRTVILSFFVLGPRGAFIVIVRANVIYRVIYFSVSMTLGVYVHVHSVHRRETHEKTPPKVYSLKIQYTPEHKIITLKKHA